MNACEDQLLQLHALLDGELDAVNSVAIEAHLKTCVGCAEEFARLGAVHAQVSDPAVQHRAPTSLRARIEAGIAAERPGRVLGNVPRRGRSTGPWLAGGAFSAMAASLALLVAVPQLTTGTTQDQLVASHVRSLLANHLTDVATSNRHVVKPWFNGRIDFAPPVPELAPQGFPLVGGRLDYLDGRVVPAIVYHRRLHTINLFVIPADTFSSPVGIATRREGYSLVRWTSGGLEFWAVSDIDPGDLELFHQAFARAAS
ncbi:anti-sigma factor [Sphingomonas sp. AR_OL41]|uniref:anti-sigma factor family protein n=1 Tax=Sphingomonas sp. AR_OL41 TaxID=3042729 RepID=UPI00247FC91F|nr:anti-sigma factor [Sphingomonas sp. AR_OL41]MDH7971571.1 anti-sigma factor [Sphingomonas sp. AR_OL41]